MRHAKAFIAEDCRVGPGCEIHALAYLGARAILVGHNVVHPGAVIGPAAGRVTLGRGARIGANAVLLDGVAVGEGASIGAGAVISENITIGIGAAVPPNAVVTKDVPPVKAARRALLLPGLRQTASGTDGGVDA
jgi:acetyltransferase-like isoleucine patch superfamily enzyme